MKDEWYAHSEWYEDRDVHGSWVFSLFWNSTDKRWMTARNNTPVRDWRHVPRNWYVICMKA